VIRGHTIEFHIEQHRIPNLFFYVSSFDFLQGVTTFKITEGTSSEDILINELGTIEPSSRHMFGDPPYTVIEVIGTGVSEKD